MDTITNDTQVAEASTDTNVEASVETSTEQATEVAPAWLWGDGAEGKGEKPEWFKDSKYKSVSEQAKAYTELEKRMGGFIGAPQEGYQLSEDIESYKDDPAINAVFEVLKGSNASNEFANQLIGTYVKAQQEQNNATLASEMKQLGDNADYRINAIKEFANAHIPETLRDDLSSMVTSAKHVQIMETLIEKMTGSKVAPQNTAQSSGVTPESLREMMFAKDSNGKDRISYDLEYKRKVDKAYQDFYGKD